MIYKIKITENFAPDNTPCIFETLISTRVSSQRVQECVSDATFLKDWLDEYQDYSYDTVNELVGDIISEVGSLSKNEKKLLNKRPYISSFSIENWSGYSWYEKVLRVLKFLLDGERIKYANVECTAIVSSCA